MRELALVALITGACSTPAEPDSPLTPTDARPDARPDAFELGPCWPEDRPHISGGSVTLGTGTETFGEVSDELALEYGVAGGYFFPVHARTTGLEPGNPLSLLDPSNPRTRVRAYVAETGVPMMQSVACFRDPYEASPMGGYQPTQGLAVFPDPCWWHSDLLIGLVIRLELEVIDVNGVYATDVKTVTLTAPPAGSYPIEQGSPGCDAP